MNKRKQDPIDGTLIGVAELSAMTGFTPHQIRSWRKPEYQDKAVFEALRDPQSSTVWYRLVDAEDWCEAHGKQSFMRAIPAPNAFRSTRVGTEIEDYAKRRAVEALSHVSTETVLAYRTKLSAQDRENLNAFMKEYGRPVWRKMRGLEPDAEVLTLGINEKNRFTNVEWFAGWVKAIRMYLNNRNGFGLSEEEIDALPIGQLPPAAESKQTLI